MERKQLSEGYSLAGDGIERDKSGHRKSATERGELTNWRSHREGYVRTRKENDRARGTYVLETPSGRNMSGEGKNETERGALTT
jgi:hypothetical protein